MYLGLCFKWDMVPTDSPGPYTDFLQRFSFQLSSWLYKRSVPANYGFWLPLYSPVTASLCETGLPDFITENVASLLPSHSSIPSDTAFLTDFLYHWPAIAATGFLDHDGTLPYSYRHAISSSSLTWLVHPPKLTFVLSFLHQWAYTTLASLWALALSMLSCHHYS